MLESCVVFRTKGSEPIEIIQLICEFHQDGDRWTSECLELGTAAYGMTLDEARNQIGEAIQLQLNQLEEMGFVDEFLRDHRVHPRQIVLPRPELPHATSWFAPVPLGA